MPNKANPDYVPDPSLTPEQHEAALALHLALMADEGRAPTAEDDWEKDLPTLGDPKAWPSDRVTAIFIRNPDAAAASPVQAPSPAPAPNAGMNTLRDLEETPLGEVPKEVEADSTVLP